MTIFPSSASSCRAASRIHIFLLGKNLHKVKSTINPGFLRWHIGKESTCQCRRCQRCGFDPWIGKTPGEGRSKPTPVFLPGNFPNRGPWRATVPGVTKSQTGILVQTHTHTHINPWTLLEAEWANVLLCFISWYLKGLSKSWNKKSERWCVCYVF